MDVSALGFEKLSEPGDAFSTMLKYEAQNALRDAGGRHTAFGRLYSWLHTKLALDLFPFREKLVNLVDEHFNSGIVTDPSVASNFTEVEDASLHGSLKSQTLRSISRDTGLSLIKLTWISRTFLGRSLSYHAPDAVIHSRVVVELLSFIKRMGSKEDICHALRITTQQFKDMMKQAPDLAYSSRFRGKVFVFDMRRFDEMLMTWSSVLPERSKRNDDEIQFMRPHVYGYSWIMIFRALCAGHLMPSGRLLGELGLASLLVRMEDLAKLMIPCREQDDGTMTVGEAAKLLFVTPLTISKLRSIGRIQYGVRSRGRTLKQCPLIESVQAAKLELISLREVASSMAISQCSASAYLKARGVLPVVRTNRNVRAVFERKAALRAFKTAF